VIAAAELQRVESETASAEAQLERAEADLRLAEAGPRADQVAAQDAEVARLAAALERAEDTLGKATVVAPLTGYLTAVHTEVGQWLAVGGRVADIVAIDSVLVRVAVNERDIGRVRLGQAATVATDAFPDRTFRGTVQRIVPQADSQSRGFPVKVLVRNPADRPLKAGMFARVALESSAARRSLLVPKDAVLANRGPQPVVFVVEHPTPDTAVARAVPVTVGVPQGDRVTIRGNGLAAGTPVVVAGQATLADGAAVVVTNGR
jgi:RND family efflux transporter MFP subunit